MGPNGRTRTRGREPRRLILFCEGTGRNGITGKTKQDSNIYRLYRVIEAAAMRDGDMQQVLLWQPGAGMEKDEQLLIESAVASKMKYKIRKAYQMIQDAYEPGDEIVLIGFSRGTGLLAATPMRPLTQIVSIGAFAARMVAAILGDIGLSKDQDLDAIFGAYAALPHWSEDVLIRKRQKAKPKVAAALEVLARHRARGPSTVLVSALAIFDTVGALGILSKTHLSAYRFFGFPVEVVGPHVDHIFHLISVDDRLVPFRETRVELTQEGIAMGQDLRQCWFGGWHTDIGGAMGGECAAIPLIWLAATLDHANLVRLDEETLLAVPGTYVDLYKHPDHPAPQGTSSAFVNVKPPKRPWGEGKVWGDLK
ncbi:hypothetical protein RQP46_006881 [Phenoliferia psychrophenolica]